MRSKCLLLSAAFLTGSAILAPPAPAAVTDSQFPPNTVRDLIAICSAGQDDPRMTAAVNFCHGFVEGAVIVEEANESHKVRASCFVFPLRGRPEAPSSPALLHGRMNSPRGSTCPRSTAFSSTWRSASRARRKPPRGGGRDEKAHSRGSRGGSAVDRLLGHDSDPAASALRHRDRRWWRRSHRCNCWKCGPWRRHRRGRRPRGRSDLRSGKAGSGFILQCRLPGGRPRAAAKSAAISSAIRFLVSKRFLIFLRERNMTLEDIAAHSVSTPNHADMVPIPATRSVWDGIGSGLSGRRAVQRRPGRSVLDPVDTLTSHVGFRCVSREGRKL